MNLVRQHFLGCFHLAGSGVHSADAPGSCSSCHNEEDYGYSSMREQEISKVLIETCCTVGRDLTRAEVARALWWNRARLRQGRLGK